MKMNLESGKPYSLIEIFSDQKRIVIPDLQRDYCWGTVHGLAESFTKSLVELFDGGMGHRKQCSLGLIYAYENPVNLINIADGQQRLTTIYLLLCILYAALKEKGKPTGTIENFLALDVSKDVWEPRLRYEVRESTRYFLKDFLNKVVKKHRPIFSLEKSGWYRNEYKNDPSVGSMVKAIQLMQKTMNNNSIKKTQLQFSQFLLGIAPKEDSSDFPLSSIPKGFDSLGLCFIYFDVQNREFGEQMYVIINTRGEPMEMNEHIKPLLISKIDDENKQEEWTKKWESWQDFFWKNKKQNEYSGDEGFNDFLEWYVQIKKQTESVSVYKYFAENKSNVTSEECLLELEICFNHLKDVWAEFKTPNNHVWADIFKQIEPSITNLRDLPSAAINSVFIPLLVFMIKRPDNKEWQYNQLRLLRQNFFDKVWGREEWLKWTDILKKTELNFSDDEVWKEQFDGKQKDQIIALENSAHFGGNLSLLSEFSAEMGWGWDDYEKQTEVIEFFYFIFIKQNLFEQKNLLRRALLTIGNYFPDNSTACKDCEWHKLIFHKMEEKREGLIHLLKYIHENNNTSINELLEEKINTAKITDWRKPFIEDPNVFNHCKDHQRIEVHESRIRVTYNMSNFTEQSTLYISERRTRLLEAVKGSRPSWVFFSVKNNEDIKFENISFPREIYAHWISVASLVLNGMALISVNSDGDIVEVGLRKKSNSKNDSLMTYLKNNNIFSDGWEIHNDWWYAVKTISLSNAFESKEKVECLLNEIDIEMKKITGSVIDSF